MIRSAIKNIRNKLLFKLELMSPEKVSLRKLPNDVDKALNIDIFSH